MKEVGKKNTDLAQKSRDSSLERNTQAQRHNQVFTSIGPQNFSAAEQSAFDAKKSSLSQLYSKDFKKDKQKIKLKHKVQEQTVDSLKLNLS